MPRRTPYTKVVKLTQIRAEHVSGMGDVVFKGFQCLDSECLEFILKAFNNHFVCMGTPSRSSVSTSYSSGNGC